MKHGTLSNWIKNKQQKKQKITDEEASSIMKNILKAVQYLHKNNIVHRDIKPGTYFLKFNYQQRIKIIIIK